MDIIASPKKVAMTVIVPENIQPEMYASLLLQVGNLQNELIGLKRLIKEADPNKNTYAKKVTNQIDYALNRLKRFDPTRPPTLDQFIKILQRIHDPQYLLKNCVDDHPHSNDLAI